MTRNLQHSPSAAQLPSVSQHPVLAGVSCRSEHRRLATVGGERTDAATFGHDKRQVGTRSTLAYAAHARGMQRAVRCSALGTLQQM